MKTRITILAENGRPLSVLGDNPEIKVKMAWEIVLNSMKQLSEKSGNDDSFVIEKVEVLE